MASKDAGSEMQSPERAYWLDDPHNVDRIVWTVYAVCALLLGADFLIKPHGPFAIEYVFGFYGFYGFLCCFGLVIAAKGLRILVARPEDYYDR
jgi:hypothetical protein